VASMWLRGEQVGPVVWQACGCVTSRWGRLRCEHVVAWRAGGAGCVASMWLRGEQVGPVA
jgi:hypothetical protein